MSNKTAYYPWFIYSLPTYLDTRPIDHPNGLHLSALSFHLTLLFKIENDKISVAEPVEPSQPTLFRGYGAEIIGLINIDCIKTRLEATKINKNSFILLQYILEWQYRPGNKSEAKIWKRKKKWGSEPKLNNFDSATLEKIIRFLSIKRQNLSLQSEH